MLASMRLVQTLLRRCLSPPFIVVLLFVRVELEVMPGRYATQGF